MIIVWRVLQILFAASLVGCSVNPAKITGGSSDGYRQMRSDLDKKIPKLLKKNDLSSMVVLVLDDQEIVYANGFGYANSLNQQEASVDIAYRVGSITKLFTAISIMQLQEQGKLNIDDSLQTYLPDFSMQSSYDLEKVTLRSMLSHYSGLPSDYDKGFSSYDAEPKIVDNLIDEYVAFKPGDVHAYSNLAYGILGQVIERVSGLTYDEYLRTNIFEPLGMKNASLGNSMEPDFAVPFKGNKPIVPMEIRDRAAGDVRMSANDLALFAKAMLQYVELNADYSPVLLSHESVTEMWRPQYNNAPLNSGYDMGLGWFLSHPSRQLGNISDLVWHDGSTFYYNSSLLIDKHEKLAVIVLSNSAEMNATFAGEVAGNTLVAAIRSKNGVQPEPYHPVSQPVNQFTDEQLTRVTGRYLSNELGEFTIRGDKERMFATIDGEQTELVSMDDGTFGIKYRLFGIIPITPAEIKDLRFQLVDYQGRQVVKVVRGPPIAHKATGNNLPEFMKQYTGSYVLTNPDPLQTELKIEELTLSDANGNLFAEIEVGGEKQSFYFDVVGEGRAVVTGYGRSKGGSAFYSINDQGQAVVEYSGLRFVKTENDPL